MNALEIKDLHVEVEGKEVVKGLNLTVNKGTVHVLMGPNGAGKSCLANVLMGNPKYVVTKGSILLDGENINKLSPDQRAKRGLFLSFQYPREIAGVTMGNFLRTAYNSTKEKQLGVIEFHNLLKEKMAVLQMDPSFSRRYVNQGFSGGEKKRAEILQMLVLDPTYAVLDECDSGTDVDALKVIAHAINVMQQEKEVGCLIITHYDRILKYLTVDKLSILVEGKIVKEGGKELISYVEEKGYAEYYQKK